MMEFKMIGRRGTALAACVAMVTGLAACGSGNGGSDNAVGSKSVGITMSDINAALKSDKDVTLDVWTWQADSVKPRIEAFEKQYPRIKINLTGTGAASDHYTKLSNVIKAGKDIPDITMLEFDYLPQYAVTGALLNFKEDSVEKDLGSLYNEAAWSDVHVAGGLYGIPDNMAPIVMYTRTDVLDKYGIETPTTWDEFEQAGIKLHQADPTKYMGYIDTADVRYMAAIMRQAEAPMWKVEGLENVDLTMTSDKVKEVAEFIQRLIDEDVLEPVASKTDEYNRGFAEGRWATKIDGAWRSSTYEKQQPDLKGKVKISLPPAWGNNASSVKTATIGGSLYAVTTACAEDKRAAAIAFINWLGSDAEAVKIGNSDGQILFSASNTYLQDSSYSNENNDYFGQKVTAIYMDSAAKINADWSILPFNSQYATDYKDIVVPQMKKGGDMFSAFSTWQSSLKTYAENQGFKVNAQ